MIADVTGFGRNNRALQMAIRRGGRGSDLPLVRERRRQWNRRDVTYIPRLEDFIRAAGWSRPPPLYAAAATGRVGRRVENRPIEGTLVVKRQRGRGRIRLRVRIPYRVAGNLPAEVLSVE